MAAFSGERVWDHGAREPVRLAGLYAPERLAYDKLDQRHAM
jgi:hypothetical protein